jgi:hypothetical protein
LKLDKRYSTFQNEIKRYSDANEEEKIPKTINEAVAKANLMVNEMGVFKNTGFKSSYPAIFSAKTHKGKSKGKKSGKYNEEDEEADKQIKGNCFKCGKKGHRKVDCPENNKKDKKEIKTTAARAETEEIDEDNEIYVISAVEKEFDVDISGYAAQTTTTKKLILDSGANKNLIGNKDLLNDIKQGKIYKIKTASGIITSNISGNLPGLGFAIYLKNAPNLVSFGICEKKFTMDYLQNNYFKCIKNGEINFTFNKDPDSEMYISEDLNDIHANVFVDTVKKRMDEFSPRQITEAKAAREAVRML